MDQIAINSSPDPGDVKKMMGGDWLRTSLDMFPSPTLDGVGFFGFEVSHGKM